MVLGTFSVLFSLAGCSMLGGAPAPVPEPVVAPAPVPEPVAGLAPGKIPLDYPVMPTTAAAGDMVLAPSREFLDKGIAEGMDNATFIYYMATMVEPGAAESKLKALSGKEFTLPNSLIIALLPGQTAAVGDTQAESEDA